jgi:hypothetical protein
MRILKRERGRKKFNMSSQRVEIDLAVLPERRPVYFYPCIYVLFTDINFYQSGGAVDCLSNTHEYLSQLRTQEGSLPGLIDEELLSDLATEVASVTAEVASVRSRIESLKTSLEELWKDEKNVEYELTSVFIHRGGNASFGHYFFYSRFLPDKREEWFKYNDSDVQSVSKEEVFRDSSGDTANPYLVCTLPLPFHLACLIYDSHVRSLCMQGRERD